MTIERRHFLLGSIAIGSVFSGAKSVKAHADPAGEIVFDSQTTDGTSITIREISTNVPANLGVMNQDEDQFIYGPSPIEPGTYEYHEVELDQLLTESAEMAVSLYDEDGSGFARDVSYVTVEDPPERVNGIGPQLIEANPEAGFEYPYYLYAPTSVVPDEPRPILVEPTNSGQSTDDFDVQLDAGERTINGTLNDFSNQLDAPAIVPVFPRPREEPNDWTHYVHALDRETMGIDGGPLERVDLQLLHMAEHAREYLASNDYPVASDGIMLNGYSASGNFVERFVTLHPDEVVSATAGGLNGMVTLPVEELQGRTLPFHIGISDVEEYTGEPFDLETYREVPQFLHLGEVDTNDTIPYDDAWTGEEFRELALDVYGQHMQDERFPLCRAIHEEVGTAAVFRMYLGEGHTPRPAMDDIVAFHQRALEGDDIEDVRRDLGGNVPNLHAYIDHTPREPAVGEQVAFDASLSSVSGRELVEFEWEFNDDVTLSGEQVTHIFEITGGHHVRLRVTDTEGETYESLKQIHVTTGVEAENEELREELAELRERDDEVPGFGVSSALVALGGAGYLMKRNFIEESEEK